MSEDPLLRFRYRNHRGEEADRAVRPLGLRFGECEFHGGPQWLLDAFCLDRGAERTFALGDILWSGESRLLAENARLLALMAPGRTVGPCACCGMMLSWLFAGDGTGCTEVESGKKDHACPVNWPGPFPEGTYRFMEARAIAAEAEKNRLEARVRALELAQEGWHQ